jgi:hypothetical protein
MSHLISETLPLIGFGLAGILFMVFTKINDLNKKPENDLLSFNQVMSKFFRKEWAAYGASVTLVFITAFSHDEWITIFAPDGKLGKIVEVPFGVKLGMVFWGAVGHYVLYKFWLGKMEKQSNQP